MFWRPKSPTTLYRVVGQREMDLILAADHAAFPPRTRAQPCFVAVPDAAYATTIARDWNTRDAPLGTARFVTRFAMSAALLVRFPALQVPASAQFPRAAWQPEQLRRYGGSLDGGARRTEYWVPAEAIGEVNGSLESAIEAIDEYPASPVWCVAANVAETRGYGEGAQETRRGTKHFPPGAKVYCFPALWGDGFESVKVVGRHRGSHRYVTMIVESRWLTNWRAELVYSPHVIFELAPHWDGTPSSRAGAEQIVAGVRRRREQADDSSTPGANGS